MFVLRSIKTNTTNMRCYLMNRCKIRLTIGRLCCMLSMSQEMNKAKQ